uniref:Ig-like domain-containing protein n=1 Tax=Electrophorus electricus TaxID=8005 RepID=A0A4W4DVY1_ELEEL
MAARYLVLLALGTAVIVTVHCCPEQCSCSDKHPHILVDCAYKELLLVPVGLPSNVTTLSLSANRIQVLKSKNFVNVPQVTSLWLAHNSIVTIERNTLTPMSQLRNLDLSYNKIIHFPWEDIANLTALQLLKMNNNEMVSLPKDVFTNLKDLRSLRINNNKFTTIVEGTFDALTSVSHLQIYNNPFSCSCKLEWMREWIIQSKISIPEKNSILCEAPAHLKGVEVTKMPKLDCQAPTVTITYQPNIENKEIYEGHMVVLNCETKGTPKPDVEWHISAGNELLKFTLPSIVEKSEISINGAPSNTRFLIFQNGTLIIPHMSKKEDGNYSCSATNDIGKADSTVKLMAATKKQDINMFYQKVGISSSGNKPGPKSSENSMIRKALRASTVAPKAGIEIRGRLRRSSGPW